MYYLWIMDVTGRWRCGVQSDDARRLIETALVMFCYRSVRAVMVQHVETGEVLWHLDVAMVGM